MSKVCQCSYRTIIIYKGTFTDKLASERRKNCGQKLINDPLSSWIYNERVDGAKWNRYKVVVLKTQKRQVLGGRTFPRKVTEALVYLNIWESCSVGQVISIKQRKRSEFLNKESETWPFREQAGWMIYLAKSLKGDVTRKDSQRRVLAQHSVTTLFRMAAILFQHLKSLLR